LTWRARQSHERWSRLVGVETEAVATLEELIRAQNSFRAQVPLGDISAPERYHAVEQLLERPALRQIDASQLRVRVAGFRQSIENEQFRGDAVQASTRITGEAQRLIASRKDEIRQQLPKLEREARMTMISGLSIVWILVMISFAAVQTMISRVVRPIEQLVAAANGIAHGGSNLAPLGGDEEIYQLGVAVNTMAAKLVERARTDDLTQLPNFRAFRERIDAEIARATRYDFRFGVLVLDLDRFKKYNDNFGHLAGNDALQRVAQAVRRAIRQVDFAARYGGEEFAVVMPQADAAALAFVGERVREGVESLPAPPDGAQLTVSIGGAVFPDDGATAEALFATADERLYKAKRDGRNRVVVATTARAVKSAG
jgi:diguanylate cyclase (GGDEF)-like protein